MTESIFIGVKMCQPDHRLDYFRNTAVILTPSDSANGFEEGGLDTVQRLTGQVIMDKTR